LNFSGKQDVYVEIAEKYKSYIRLGVIKSGEKLPSVREAAGELGVNPNTIARAYSLLEEQGYVRSLPKKGAFVIYGEAEERKEPDKREIIYALRDMGISKNTLINWIEEVYKDD
jgi:GntR family transcriptional regulator